MVGLTPDGQAGQSHGHQDCLKSSPEAVDAVGGSAASGVEGPQAPDKMSGRFNQKNATNSTRQCQCTFDIRVGNTQMIDMNNELHLNDFTPAISLHISLRYKWSYDYIYVISASLLVGSFNYTETENLSPSFLLFSPSFFSSFVFLSSFILFCLTRTTCNGYGLWES